MTPDIADPVLAGLLGELRDVQGRLEHYLAGSLVLAPAVPRRGWPTFADDPDLISVAAAAKRSRQSPGTIRRWCRDDSIGRRYGKDWRVSISRLVARLDR